MISLISKVQTRQLHGDKKQVSGRQGLGRAGLRSDWERERVSFLGDEMR